MINEEEEIKKMRKDKASKRVPKKGKDLKI